MKDSGIPWIGEIPEHWEICKLSNFLTQFTEKNHADKPLLSVTRDKGVILRGEKGDDDNHNVIPEDLSGYKHVLPGDFIINKMKSWQGSYGLTDFEGIVSPAYFTYHLNFTHKKFFSIALRSSAYIPFFSMFSKGIRVDQWDLIPEALKMFPFFVPPVAEQEAIAAYLDAKCGEIDELIDVEQQMISDLESYRQAVITEAVTHGLNPDVPTKDSGIDWIAKIPSHWFVVPVKHIFDNLDYLRQPISAENRERNNPQYDYYGASGVIDKIDYYNVEDTVLLIGEDGANLVLRNLPLIYKASGKFWVNNHAHILRPKKNHNYFYMAYLLEAGDYSLYISGTAQPKLSQENLNRFPICIPPLSEQQEIAEYLDAKCAEIDELIMVKHEKIKTLKQYRQSLIFEAVTGKIAIA